MGRQAATDRAAVKESEMTDDDWATHGGTEDTWRALREINGEGQKRIFSGDDSREMWDKINGARTVTALRYAMYGVCCKLQEFERAVHNKQESK